MSNTPLQDLEYLHKKAAEMLKTAEKQKHSDIIKLQMDTLDALVRLANKFKAWL